MTEPRLIALCSRAMGSGKSTIAERLIERHGFQRIAFATPLKQMAEGMLDALGLPIDEVRERVWGSRKEEMIPGVGITSRRLQQLLGTEFGREMIRPSLWIDIAMEATQRLLDAGRSVVIDDMRFINELVAVRTLGGSAWRITRPGVTVTSPHASEGQLDHVRMDEFRNSSTLSDLHIAVDNWMSL